MIPTARPDRQARRPRVAHRADHRATGSRCAHRARFGVAIIFLGALAFLSPALAQQPFTLQTPVVVTAIALRVREAPGLTARIVTTIPNGSKGVVVDAQPHWADGYWWWDIEYRDGARGWSADGDNELIYLVEDANPAAPQVLRPTSPPRPSSPDGTAVAGRSSLTVVVIPSIMSALSLTRYDLQVRVEGPETHLRVVQNVAPAFPVTIVFDDIATGTYTVTALHGGSRLSRQVAVSGRTLHVDFVMP